MKVSLGKRIKMCNEMKLEIQTLEKYSARRKVTIRETTIINDQIKKYFDSQQRSMA